MQSRPIQLPRVELLKLMTLDHVSWSRLGFRPEVFGEFNSVEHYPVFT